MSSKFKGIKPETWNPKPGTKEDASKWKGKPEKAKRSLKITGQKIRLAPEIENRFDSLIIYLAPKVKQKVL